MAIVDQADLNGDPDANNAQAHDDTDVFVLYTDDQGQNWTGPIRVNDDSTMNSQMLPWLDVDQLTGVVAVGWYDARDDDGTGGAGDTNNIPNDDVQFFATASRDGGMTFLPNVQISDGTSNESGAEPYPAGFANFDYGEYPGIAIRGAIAHAVWADNSDSTGDNPDGPLSKQDIYTAELRINLPPAADAGLPETAECTGVTGASVTLDGTGSSDPNGDPITFFWSAPGIVFDDPTSATPTATFPLGSTDVTLTVTDTSGETGSDDVVITVIDTTAPQMSLSVAKDDLWPPNHQMVDVGLGLTVSDTCDPSPEVSIRVTTDEPTATARGAGGRKHAPDAEIIGDDKVIMRAERSGRGDGRVYVIDITATEAAGNQATSSVAVSVDHDKKRAAIDSGQNFDATEVN
jgi:hypothetical protein